MAISTSLTGDAGADDAVFAQDSHLTYLVPVLTDERLEKALAQHSGPPQAFIEALEDRECLYFDETVDVYLILSTPYRGEAHLQACLARLALHVEAQIVNGGGSIPGRDSPVLETIFNGVVEDVTKPLAVVHEGGDDKSQEEEQHSDSDDNDGNDNNIRHQPRQCFVFWKLNVFLSRPRGRLHAPAVMLAASASLMPAPLAPEEAAWRGGRGRGYLRSREPSGLNMLAALGEGFTDEEEGKEMMRLQPRLSAQRVSRVAPVGAGANAGGFGSSSRDSKAAAALAVIHPIPGRKPASFRIVPAVHARVRFARTNAMPTTAAVMAMLELDVSAQLDCEAVLSAIRLTLPGGVVTDLNGGAATASGASAGNGLTLPLYGLAARDHFTFLYRLAPEMPEKMLQSTTATTTTIPTSASTRHLTIAIDVQALVQPNQCTPSLRLTWTTALDFTLPVNPEFGSAIPPASLQRAHRPSQLSMDGMSSFMAPAVSRPDALPGLEAAVRRGTETTIPDFGITVTFAAPSTPVYAGEPFCWTVLVVNRVGGGGGAAAAGGPGGGGPGGGGPGAARHAPPGGHGPPVATPPAPRKLALIALPQRRRNEMRVIRPPSTHYQQQQPQQWHQSPQKSLTTNATATTTSDLADAVLDENIVHAMQRSSLVDSTDVVCLSADTRVGPLAPNACHAVELRFVALRAGVVGMEAIRVVDLGSQEHVDVRELPMMWVQERAVAAAA